MENPSLIGQQKATCSNLHHGALAMLDVKDAVEEGDFETADAMLAKIEEAINFTRVAIQGMQLIQESQDI